jgi:ditrans,polycis-polyprenyl diphosphate synthase
MRLNVRCVSVYAFSIENFKRAPDEVDALMVLAEEKLLALAQRGSLLSRYGVRLNVLGRTELLPPAVRAAVHKAEDMTRTHDRAVLNLCMPYTARDEIAQAVSKTVRAAVADDLDPECVWYQHRLGNADRVRLDPSTSIPSLHTS